MPVESTPTLSRPEGASASSAFPLDRHELAVGPDVEPILGAARAAVAALADRAGAAAAAAADAEAAAFEAAVAEQDARARDEAARTEAEADVARARADLATALDEARRRAAAEVAAARDEAALQVSAARRQLDAALAELPGGRQPPGGVAPSTPPDPSEPRAVGPLPLPPPTVGPAAPLPQGTLTTVLVQAPDGTLQPTLVLTATALAPSPGPPAAWAPATAAVPALMGATDGSALTPSAPGRSPGGVFARLWHLDVVLPIVAMVIVLVVLLAWLG